MVRITAVQKASLADKAGILAGDCLVSADGHEIKDVLDYRFYLCTKCLSLVLIRDGKEYVKTIKKDEYDDIGLEFETFLMDCKHACRNACIFCFIDQLPRGMRDTLYFKDDDSRLSFLQGNYITLTNLGDEDVERIIKMHMSPINISVHTTNPDLRVSMLRNKNAGRVLSYIDRFAEAGIEINAQIVLCRGINDGEELTRTMHDLAVHFPQVASVSIVPAGLTRFRDNLYPLTPFSKEEAVTVIKQVESFAQSCKNALGSSVFYCSDEFYLQAGLPLHDGDYYEGYKQIENGVGMISSMREEFSDAIRTIAPSSDSPREYALATGVAAYPFISELANQLMAKYPFLTLHVYSIENDFFGKSVTVCGLVTGKDLIHQLSGKPLGSRLYLPASMLRYDRDRFLCDTTTEELSKILGVPLCFCENDGYDFVEKLLS